MAASDSLVVQRAPNMRAVGVGGGAALHNTLPPTLEYLTAGSGAAQVKGFEVDRIARIVWSGLRCQATRRAAASLRYTIEVH